MQKCAIKMTKLALTVFTKGIDKGRKHRQNKVFFRKGNRRSA